VPVTATGVLAGKTVVGLAAGNLHSLALCSDGTVAAWGNDSFGQLGDNWGPFGGPSRSAPVLVNTTSGLSALYGRTVVSVAAGYYHSLALGSDGGVTAWGGNSSGQVGDHSTTRRFVPVAVNTNAGVSALYGKTVVAIAAGANHSLALCSDGTVTGWGTGPIGDSSPSVATAPIAVNTQAGISALYGKTVVAIAAGANHSLALCSDGTVAAWGVGSSGQLGNNNASSWDRPVAVNTNAGLSALYGKTVVAIAAGANHSLALCADGTIAAWGDNASGQLGDGTTTERRSPVVVVSPLPAASQRFTRVFSSCDSSHTLALLVTAPAATEITLTDSQTLVGGAFQFGFTNAPGAFFSVLAATSPALPISNWTTLGDPTEGPPGQFYFTDSQATNTSRRFYRVRSP
jgi:alpha-tubulin suppressor-like RCC1 family protein